MNDAERIVRAAVYRLIIASGRGPTVAEISAACSMDDGEVAASLLALQEAHLIVMMPDEPWVMMAHPFSGIPTGSRAVVGERSWHANCAWDALAILTMMGDGEAHIDNPADGLVWDVTDGVVSPEGVIHMRVPARSFWDDIGLT